jgi:hypothetical protein
MQSKLLEHVIAQKLELDRTLVSLSACVCLLLYVCACGRMEDADFSVSLPCLRMHFCFKLVLS